MPPPKQKPIAASGAWRPTRLAISVSAAFMSSSKRAGFGRRDRRQRGRHAPPRPGTRPCRPPRRAGRARAPTSPLAAKRPATLRMCGVEPAVLVDHEHAALGLRRRCAHAASSVPARAGERDRLSSRPAPRPSPRRRVPVPVTVAVAASPPLFLPRCAPRPRPRSSPTPRSRHAEQPEPPHRLAPGDDPVDVVLGDLFREVPLELRHPTLPENVDRPTQVARWDTHENARRRAKTNRAGSSRLGRLNPVAACLLLRRDQRALGGLAHAHGELLLAVPEDDLHDELLRLAQLLRRLELHLDRARCPSA